MERIVKGIWIPLEIWQEASLCWNEKILLMEIDSFTCAGKDCYISNEYIADLLGGISPRTASRYLNHLIDAGYVKVVRYDGRKRYIESVIRVQSEWTNLSNQSRQECPHTYTIDLNKNIDKERENKGTHRFQKPSIAEVSAYCRERGNTIDPEEFFAFYESKGWMVGKSPLKDRKAAIVTWEKSAKKKSTGQRQPRRRETVFEHNLRAIDQVMGTNMHEQFYGGRADEQ